MVICLERGANDLHVVQLMPLPPRHLLLQQNPERFILLVPAYPGCPGKKAFKRLCVCVYSCIDSTNNITATGIIGLCVHKLDDWKIIPDHNVQRMTTSFVL